MSPATEAAASEGEPAAPSLLELRSTEHEILTDEIPAFARVLKEPDARERYGQFEQAVRAGGVPPALVPALEALLELLLQTQRVRRQHGPEAEEALSDLFYRTPRGAGLRRAAREVNAALDALRGHRLDKLSVMAGPGRHTLLLMTDRCQLTLKLDPAGARIEKLEVGG